jgi:hypothetical protein
VREIPVRHYPGYVGAFTRDEAPGAIPNGTRVCKVWCEPGDANPLGAKGVVLGSLYFPEGGFAYFIEWDSKPKWPLLTIAKKVEAIQ